MSFRGVVLAPAAIAMLVVSLLPVSAWGQATTSSRNETILFTEGVISCSGDVVRYEGDLHFVVHSTVDAGGGGHLVSHDNFKGASGESSSGVPYRVVGAALDDGYTTHFGEGGAYQETEAERTRNYISQGPEDDIVQHVVHHL